MGATPLWEPAFLPVRRMTETVMDKFWVVLSLSSFFLSLSFFLISFRLRLWALGFVRLLARRARGLILVRGLLSRYVLVHQEDPTQLALRPGVSPPPPYLIQTLVLCHALLKVAALCAASFGRCLGLVLEQRPKL